MVRDILQNQQTHCDRCASVSYTARQACIIVSRPQWSSQSGELCTAVRPREKIIKTVLTPPRRGDWQSCLFRSLSRLPEKSGLVRKSEEHLESVRNGVGEAQMHLRVFFDEKVRDVNLFQGVTCSKVNTLHHSREGNVPDAPGGVNEIWARVFGAIDID